jgi:recombination protein RecT
MENAETNQSENQAKPQTLVRQSGYQQLCEAAGVKRESVVAEIRKYVAANPDVERHSKEALFALAVSVLELGLSLAPALGHAYILPGRNGPELSIGYRGLLKLAHDTGRVTGVEAQVVREHDEFQIKREGGAYTVSWSSGLDAIKDGGMIVGAYSIVTRSDGPPIVAILRMDAVLELRQRKGAHWQKDPDAMVRKTVLAQALRLLPGLGALPDADDTRNA